MITQLILPPSQVTYYIRIIYIYFDILAYILEYIVYISHFMQNPIT